MLEKTLGSPLDSKEIKPVNPKGDHSWIFIEKTDVEAEALILWPPNGKSWLIGKDPDSGKDWGQEEKETTEDEMVGWHHQLNGHESEQLWEIVKDRKAWCAAVHGVTKSWTKLSGWTPPTTYGIFPDQGLNLCPLYWQVDPYPLYCQEVHLLIHCMYMPRFVYPLICWWVLGLLLSFGCYE